MAKVLLIDPEAKTITEASPNSRLNLTEIYSLTDAQTIEIVGIHERADLYLIVDEEGLYTKRHFFAMAGQPESYVGKSVVCKMTVDDESNETLHDIGPEDEAWVRSSVSFDETSQNWDASTVIFLF